MYAIVGNPNSEEERVLESVFGGQSFSREDAASALTQANCQLPVYDVIDSMLYHGFLQEVS